MTVFYTVTLILMAWVSLLAMNVSRLRVREGTPFGVGDKLVLKQSTRAHINALEQSLPYCLILFVACSLNVSSSVLIALSAIFCLGRIMHAISYPSSIHIMRQLGALFSYLTTALLIVFALLAMI